MYDDYKVLLKKAHPGEQARCRRRVVGSIRLLKGHIYVVDARYWTGSGDKCFKVRACSQQSETRRFEEHIASFL